MKTLWIALLMSTPVCKAVQISHDQRGDVLVFPYFTGLQPFNSLISISNTSTSTVAAVRLTFRGREGGGFSLNAYLDPGAAWVGAITDQGLQSNTDQCALGPGLLPVPELIGDIPPEGFLEVYEIGRLRVDDEAFKEQRLDCQKFQRETLDWRAPISGIAGQIHLVDAQTGTSFTLSPLVLDNFSVRPLHSDPMLSSPNLSDANPLSAELMTDAGSITTTWDDPLEMINAVLAVYRLESDFTLESEIGARHELILTLPTLDANGAFSNFGPPLFVSGRSRGGFPRWAGNTGAKCTPGFIPPRPYAEQPLVRLRLGGGPIFPGSSLETTHVSLVGNGCGFSTQQPFADLFSSGRVMVQPGQLEFVSREGVVVRGLPMVAASVTRLVNQELVGLPASYGLTNALDIRRNIEPAPPSALASACRNYNGNVFALNSETGMGITRDGHRGSLLLLDSNLDVAFSFDDPLVNLVFSPATQVMVAFRNGSLVLLDLSNPQTGLQALVGPAFLADQPQLAGVSDNGRFLFFHMPDRSILRFDRNDESTLSFESDDFHRRWLVVVSGDGKQAIVRSSGRAILEHWDLDSGTISDLLSLTDRSFQWDVIAFVGVLAASPTLNDLVLHVRGIDDRFLYRLDRLRDELTLLNPENLSEAFVDLLTVSEPQASINDLGDGMLTTFLQLGPGSIRSSIPRLWRVGASGQSPSRLDLLFADGERPFSVARAQLSNDGSVILAAMGTVNQRADLLCRFDLMDPAR